MATAGDLFDLTGLTQQKNIPAGTKTTTGGGTTGEASTTKSQQSSSKTFSGQNTPQFALNALQELIASLSDHATVSQEAAYAKAPNLVQKITTSTDGTFITWTDPLTGQPVPENMVPKLQAERAVQRQQMITEGGVTAGGTIETRRASTERQTEIARDREQQSKYSKDAAFADATALQGRFTRQLLEQLMPNITKAAESSGTSGGAVAGLMAQDAAARTAEAQSALGLQTAAQYGQLYNQLAGTLELLTRDASPTTKALLEAIGLSRGTINIGSEANSVSGTSTTTGTKVADQTSTELSKGEPPAKIVTPSNTVQQGVAAPANTSTPYMSIKANQNSDNSFKQLLDALIAPNTSGEYRF